VLKRTLHTIWLLVALALLLTAIALTVVRLWMPTLAGYRQEIEAAAGELLHRQVSIGKLAASWEALSPVLRLKDVVIADGAGGRPLEVREIRLSLDVEHYLAEHEVRLAGIGIVGTDLTLVRDAAGELFIEELGAADGAATDAGGLAGLQRLSIQDSSITIDDRLGGEPPHRFEDVRLALINDSGRHVITGYAWLPEELGRRMDIEAVFAGPDNRPGQWRGRLYVNGQSVVLPRIMARWLPDKLAVQGVADVRLWVRIAAQRMHALSGELDIRDLLLDDHQGEQPYQFSADSVSGQFGWHRTREDWQFAVQNVEIRQGEQSWRTDNLSLAGRTLQGTDYLAGASARINLDGVSTLFPILPGLDAAQRRRLSDLQPRGVIKDLHFAIRKSADALTVTGFNARFAGLSIEQSEAIPALQGLDGELRGTFDAGTLTLDSRNAGYHDRHLFREVLPIKSARGDIRWWHSAGHFELASDKLTVENGDIALDARFGLDFPPAGESASINLAIGIRHVAVARIGRYLPARIMPETGVAWLDRSLAGGTVTNGSVIVNGRFDQMPFDHGEGTLEVRLPVTDGVLDYNPDWTPVRNLDARVDVSGRRMDIRSTQGTIRSAALKDVHAWIADLEKPDLRLQGQVHGALPVMLAELGSSPLGEIYGGFVDRVTTTGNSDLALDLRVPLHGEHHGPVEASGRITLADNGLRIKDSRVALEHMRGELSFDAEGIKGDKLKASLFGKPARARVWTLPGKGGTKITLEGPFDLLGMVLGKDAGLGAQISGGSDWQVLLSLRGIPRRGEKADVGLEVYSSLAGTAIDLPAPFGKSAESTRKLSIMLSRIDYPEKEVRFNYADLLKGRLQFATVGESFQLQRGALRLGGGTPGLPSTESLLVTGRLASFRLQEWRPYLTTAPVIALPVTVRADIGELELPGYVLRDVGLKISRTGLVWNINSEGPSLAGDIELTQTDAGLEKVVMILQRLVLESRDKAFPEGTTAIGPADFPELQFTARQFVYDKADLGLVQLEAQRAAGAAIDISNLAVASDLIALHGSGRWQGEGEGQTSSMQLEVTGGQMDKLMEAFGYQKSIKGGALTGTMNAAWPGAPWSFAPSVVEGKFEMAIKKGQLLDVNPGAAGRVLGLLSVTALPRRLVLDFSDLFGEGLSFDTIEGSFIVEDGNAFTHDLMVDGPSARILITGRVGIVNQDYDEQVTVIPYLKTGVSLLGSLAAGPAIGAALIVAESLLEDQIGPLSRMAQKRYSVTGSWADPVVTRVDAAGRKVQAPDAATK
jgi:uncharacterized protein (TIGR02099 family)